MKIKIKQLSLLVFILFAFGFLSTPVFSVPVGQDVDLVKLKKEEEKRKKKLKKSKYVVTNDSLKNLGKVKGKGSLSKAGGKSKTGEKEKAQPTTPAPAAPTVDELDKEREEKCKYWQKQKSDLIFEIYKTKSDLEDLIMEHNKIAREFDLATSETQRKMMERTNEISKALENGKKRITELEKEMTELGEKARKAGVLPGCLREIEYPPKKK